MSLVIKCQEHYDKVVAWAHQNYCLEKLKEKLDYLTTYADSKCVCELYSDFAPHSFEFAIIKDGKFWFNGGLIYHEFDKTWGVHT